MKGEGELLAHRLTRIADAATDLIGISDRAGQILYMNPAGRELLGVTPDEELTQDSMEQFYSAETHQQIRAVAIPHALAHGSWEGDTTLVASDGSAVPVSQALLVHRDANGAVEFMSTIARDLRERKAAEEELQAALEKLQDAQQQILQSEKLAAIGQLAAGVAHEINNPMAFIQSNLRTLESYTGTLERLLTAYDQLEEALSPEHPAAQALHGLRTEEDIDYIRADLGNLISESLDGAARVRQIVLDLRDFFRLDSSEWTEADLHQCLETTLNMLSNELKYRCELVRDYGNLPPVECLPSQLNQVFLNLVLNAAQAIKETGTVTVSTGYRPEEETVWVEIRDTGVGIRPSDLNRIFNPFFTTKPEGQGTGLGLPLAFRIVQAHGGTLEATSELGEGSCFRMTLPRTQNGREEPSPTTQGSSDP